MSYVFLRELNGSWKRYEWPCPDELQKRGIVIHETAKVGDGCYLGNRSIMGNGSSIGNYSGIGNYSSMGDGSSMGDHSSIGCDTSIGNYSGIGNYSSMGDHSSIGNHSFIGDGSYIGDHSFIGDGSSMGNDSSMGDGQKLPTNTSLLTMVISPYTANTLPDGRVRIGCKHLTIKEWEELGEEMAKKENIPPESIRLYRSFIEAAKLWNEKNVPGWSD